MTTLCRGGKSWCTLRSIALSTGFHQQSISTTAALGCILVCSVLFCYVLLDKLAAAFDAILFVDALESLVEHFCSILCFSGQGNAHWQAHRNRYTSIRFLSCYLHYCSYAGLLYATLGNISGVSQVPILTELFRRLVPLFR